MNNKNQDEEIEFVWPSHSDFLIDSIYDTMIKECFTDVTLVCMDGTELKSLKVHRMVLAACSPMLAKLFKENEENHPLEFEGIQYSDLKCLIDFMYAGQTVVPIDREKQFLSIAKCFRVEVLCSKSQEQDNIVGGEESCLKEQEQAVSATNVESIGNDDFKQVPGKEQIVIIDDESEIQNLESSHVLEEIENGDMNSAYTNFTPILNEESHEAKQNNRIAGRPQNVAAGRRVWNCICPFKTEDEILFDEHQKRCLFCYVCKIFFHTKPSYKNHFQKKHPSTPMFMGKNQSSKQKDGEIKQNVCLGYGCNEDFYTTELLEAHVQKCHKFLMKALSEGQHTYKYWCLNCLLKFDNEERRKEHSRVCNGLQCKICTQTLAKPDYLRAHILFTHKEHTFNYELLKCKLCQVKTQSKTGFLLNFHKCNKALNNTDDEKHQR